MQILLLFSCFMENVDFYPKKDSFEQFSES